LFALILGCGGADDDEGGSSVSTADAGSESTSASEESGDSGGSQGTGDTGSPTDCTDDPDTCDPGTTCYCFDQSGDGTNVTCWCAQSCSDAGGCPAELPNCGCSTSDTKACVSDQTCFGG
jgi:hypothetical protein